MSHRHATIVLLGIPCSALAQTLPEVEPNESKTEALLNPYVLQSGAAITGMSTGGSTTTAGIASADYLLIQTAQRPLGVYKHRLVLTTSGTAGHTLTIRGRTQSAGVIAATSDVALYQGQTSSVPPRYVQWYGFGKQERVYARVSGTSSTTAPYLCTLETSALSVPFLGDFKAGQITISTLNQGHTTDTALWVYDGTLSAVPEFGNDDEPAPGTSARSTLTRTFAPGTYYLAITAATLAVEHPAASDDSRRNANVTDFANVAISTATTTAANLSFQIADEYGAVPTTSFKEDRHEINFFRFTVSAQPVRGACCLDDMSCIIATTQLCAARSGVYGGDGSTCSTVTCPAPGGCCSHGACVMMSPRQCQLTGGSLSSAASCASVSCTPGTATPLGLPAQNSVFSSTTVYSRGLWFTAPANIVITGLRVPDPALHGTQHVEVVRLGEEPPTDVAGTNNLVSLLRRTGLPSEAIITTSIPVQAGQIIGILGGCGDTSVLSASYSANATFQSEILGQPVTLRRLQMQHNLVTVPARALSTGPNEIGRVELYYAAAGFSCYANCDGSTIPPVLNVGDFTCFLQRFAAGASYANCDGSTTPPVLNVGDFTCFLQRFAAGCP
jgi:hypothetical protein